MIGVSAPVRVRDLLRRVTDGPVPVVHRGPDAVYLAVRDDDGREGCVGVLGAHAVPVPCGLRSGIPALDVGTAAVRGGTLHLDDEPVAVRRLVDTRVPARSPLPRSGLRPAPGLPPAVTPGAVAGLVGRGEGLTPLGDDVLCGWLALHRSAAAPTPEVDAAVRAHLHRTTLLSAELLRCALRGEVVPQFAALVTALGTPAEPAAAAALAAVGHTSGAAMLHGAALALSALHTEGVAA
ncbi:DUF2877 domain-containing protein [Pseudonocardia spirodelae]|uniref:DUF2877 domain-containing protein n=1 Tax=Pseudonocardia spirodelae TaxID=3133431 RepID=A0ABU8T4S1_9PSEU